MLVLSACSDDRPRPPNVLLISIDTLRADRLGGYGFGKPTSPAIDRLLATSVVFDDAQTVSPWTLPSFASLMTGQPPATHRCVAFESSLSPAFETLAERLQAVGFETAAVVSHVFLAPEYGLDQGFEDYDVSLVQKDGRRSHWAISSEAISDRAIAWLDAHGHETERPFLLWLHYFDPHWIYHRHEGLGFDFGRGNSGRYEQEIAFTDRNVGRVLDRLGALGLDADTIVVFVADHGEEFGEHGYKQHGRSLYAAAMRVPFAIRVPGFEPRRVVETVSLVDFLPTLLELVKRPAEDPLPGRSLVGLMRGEAAETRPARLESRLHHRKDVDLEGLVTERWKLVVEWPKAENPLALRTSDGPVRTLLFDRRADPKERADVSARNLQVVATLRRALEEGRARAEETADGILGPVELAPSRVLSDDQVEHLRALGYIESDDEAPPSPSTSERPPEPQS